MVGTVLSDSYRLRRAPTGKRAVSAILPRNRPPAALRPRESVAFVRRRPETLFGVKAVGSFVPRLTRKAFEKYGFSAATLITDWPTIVGRELAAYTAPERLKWPRGVEQQPDDADADSKGRPGATLVLRVDGGRSLDIQHGARQLIERINAYFGYAAVRELRIVQAPVDAGPILRPPPGPAARPLTHEVASVADPSLRDALARLGASVRASR
jgi:hypothetical protein